MVYVALIFSSQFGDEDTPPSLRQGPQIAAASYNDLEAATSMSRAKVAAALSRLVELRLVVPIGSHQQRRYTIVWEGRGWFKLPCQHITAGDAILPFKHLVLRSKHSLHAMKLYLYLAAVRDNAKAYAVASYETIFKRIDISERDIRKAISTLIAVGLLRSVHREHEAAGMDRAFGPNMYFLTGSDKLAGYSSSAGAV